MSTGPVTARNIPRAPRFQLHMPVLVRLLGEDNWREGITENVSRSGVLLRLPGQPEATQALSERSPLEIHMALPAQIPGTEGASIICHAQVVRTVAPNGHADPAYAASICDYNLVPGFGG